MRLKVWFFAMFCMMATCAGAARATDNSHLASLNASKPILVFGDSLSAGYGLPSGSGWVQLLEQRVKKEAPYYYVTNASISGETTSGGNTRLPEVLARVKPAIVILELGANDGLQGLPLKMTETNLNAMVTASQAAGARVLIVGMQLPPNYGKAYIDRFSALFGTLATHYHTALVPFFMDGFADKLDFFQADHIHPNIQGQPLLLDNVWPQLWPLLKQTGKRQP